MQICFIGNELYPADRGGIARLLHNMALQVVAECPTAHVHLLLPAHYESRRVELAATFPKQVRLWTCPTTDDIPKRLNAQATKLTGIGRHPELFADSAAYLFGAMDIEAEIGLPLTHIEIPDHLGYGNLILAARAAGIAFQGAEIACRIHSAFAQLLNFEPDYYPKDSWHGARIDMEAECLALSDRIIAPLRSVAKAVASAPTFPADKTIEINFPPVLDQPPELRPLKADLCADFVFASRFQPFKRAELFIRAAVTMLDNNPDYSGTFRLMAYTFDSMYLASLRMMVPQRHAQRIIFEIDLSSDAREARLAQSIVVQPSSYESLCLLAYETAATQRPILLAKDCAAFANADRWVDGKNCLLFSPTPAGLAHVMKAALDWRPSVPVSVHADRIWPLNTQVKQPTHPPVGGGTVVIGPLSDPRFVSAISSLARRLPAGWAVHVYSIGVDFQDAFDDDSIRHHVADACDDQARFLIDILEALDCKNICLATPDTLPQPALLKAAQQLDEGLALSALSARSSEVAAFAGTSPCLALQDSRLAPTCLCLPRSEALRIIRKTASTRRIVAGMIMALQADRLRLVIAPKVWVDQDVSPFTAPDDLRLHGTQLDRQAAGLMSSAHLGRHDAPGKGTTSLLREDVIAFEVDAHDQLTQAAKDRIDIVAPPGKTSFDLILNAPLGGHMVRCTIVPGDDMPNGLTLDVTTTDSADQRSEQQRFVVSNSKQQLILLGPFYGLAAVTISLLNPTTTSAHFSIRRLRRISPA